MQIVATDAIAQVAQPVPVPDLTAPAVPAEKLSVGEKADLDYSPLRMRLGGFIFSPSLTAGEEFERNIFSSHSGVQSDFITLIRPAFDLVSDWNLHAISLHAEADLSEYARFRSENADNFVIENDDRLDILRGQYLAFGAGFQSLQEVRSSPDSIEAVLLAGGTEATKPTTYTVATGHFSYVYAPALTKLELDGSVADFQFSNVPTTNGGLAINSDRNRTEYTLTPKIGYEFMGGYQAYFQLSGDVHQYDATFDATPARLQRNSAGYAAAVGIDFDINSSITGSSYVGYQAQFYQDPRLSTIQGGYLGGSILWNATELTSLRLTLSRSIEDTIVLGSSGFWDTEADIAVEYALRRNLLLTGTATIIDSDYQGSALSDDQFGFKGSAVWKLDRNFSLNASADWLRQTSSHSLSSFDQEIAQLSLKAQL